MESEPTQANAEDSVARRKRFVGYVANVLHGVVSIAASICILEMTTTPDGSTRSRNLCGISSGVFLSYFRPFTSFLLFRYRPYVLRRTPSGKANEKMPQMHVFIEASTSLRSMPGWVKTLLDLFRPVVLGLATVWTGLLFPSIFLLWVMYRQVSSLPQGASLRILVIGVVGIMVLTIGLAAGLVALLVWISAKQNDPIKEEEDAVGSHSSIMKAIFNLYTGFVPMFPLALTLATARNFDLHNIEDEGDLEVKLQRLRDDADQVLESFRLRDVDDEQNRIAKPTEATDADSSIKAIVHQPPALDKNGKIPEPVNNLNAINGSVRIGHVMVTVLMTVGVPYDRRALRTFDPSKLPKLELPIWSSAVAAMQMCALGGILAALFLQDQTQRVPSYMHPIKLFDLFLPSVADRANAVVELAPLMWLWGFMTWVVMVVFMLASAYQQGGMQSAKKLWFYEDNIWNIEQGQERQEVQDNGPMLIEIE
ncbi:unnamed protein product [Tilletia controversa]|uniref:Uncharacterized protein n=4 Tax=Tilletia TaxID=13289 RepID=A0A8X7MRM5_9BASI|nr:hypothetical protein CF328_g2583 [Tilletia controversa]CAD6888692.1 unnamed protein product [Tilletia caries]CAD6926856.1 unnamed protein product [Tilletia laevis]KAE8245498.1 hypothetical protein A4X06_0g5659 [Tilletia controversa]CAD6909420.1 unnamed protein product [Tilletia controversa]